MDAVANFTIPDLSPDSEVTSLAEYPAVILLDTAEAGREGSVQWHLGIKPYTIEVGGKTGMFHNYANFSTSERSTCGVLLQAFKKALKAANQPTNLAIGRGNYVGKEFWFKMTSLKFGTNQETGEKIVKEIHLPVRVLTPEEKAGLTMVSSTPTNVSGAPTRPATLLDLSSDAVDALVEIYAGKKEKEAQKAALKSDLSKDLKNAVMSGEALKWLVDHDKLVVESDDVINIL